MSFQASGCGTDFFFDDGFDTGEGGEMSALAIHEIRRGHDSMYTTRGDIGVN